MRIAGLPVAEGSAGQVGPVGGSSDGSGWLGVLERTMGSSAGVHGRSAANPDARVAQLSELIKLQMEVCRHQVQVELVSKVAESGVASVRKLQQPQ